MPTIAIPTFAGNPLHSYSVRLGTRDFRLAWDWNGRLGRWYLSLYTLGGELLQGGAKVLPNWPLFGRNPDPRFPGGLLAYVVATQDPQPPSLTDLGIGGTLIWTDETLAP